MKIERIARVVSAAGAVLLFGAWLLQATLVDRANDALSRVDDASRVYQTYQSNNALFNALLVSIADARRLTYGDYNYPSKDARSVQQVNYETVRKMQATNYELGLADMERALEPSVRRTIPPADVEAPPAEALERIQTRLERIQVALRERRSSLVDHKHRVYWVFFSVYLFGSLAVVAASVIGSGSKSA
jgi:hypothetical protein